MINSFLLIGQSNMAGRGFLKDVPQIFDEHIKMLRNGRWQTMMEPISNDRPSSGVGLASSFAAAWRLKNTNDEIGLIPCADGGTSLDDWAVGGTLYEHAISQAKLAQRTSNIIGILWHQGESDSFSDRSSVYYSKFASIIGAFRHELSVDDIPLVVGGLADFLSTGRYSQYFTEYPLVNQVLLNYTDTNPNSYFVTAVGLTPNPDGVHINAVSQRIFGVRYFEAFDKHCNVLEPLADENKIIHEIEKRPFSKSEKIFLVENRFAIGELSVADYQIELSNLRV